MKARLSASVRSELLEAAALAVKEGRATTISAWVEAALEQHLAQERRLHALGTFVTAFEAAHGVLTPADEAQAALSVRRDAVLVRGGKRDAVRPPGRRRKTA